MDRVSPAYRRLALACHLVAATLLLSLFAGQLTAKDILRLGYVGWDAEDPICLAINYGANEYANSLETRYRRIEIVTVHPKEDSPGYQRDAFFNILGQQISGLILGPNSKTTSTAEYIAIAREMNIPVVILREELPDTESKPLATITMDENAAAKLAMETMLQKLRLSQSTFAVIHQQDGSLIRHAKRMEAATAVLQAYNKDSEPIYRKQARFFSVSDNSVGLLQETYHKAETGDIYGEIDGWLLLGSWPVIGPGLYPVRNDPPHYSIVVMDTPPSALALIADGQISAGITTDYSDWGRRAVEILSGKLEFATDPGEPLVKTEPVVINAQNAAEWQAKWARWML